MVITLPAQFPLTPAGNPTKVAPLAPVVAYVMLVMAVLIHLVWLLVPAAEDRARVFSGVMFSVPVLVMVPQPPVSVIVYGNTPETEGVPLIVITLPDQLPATPAGKPLKVAPVAPVVV